MTKVNQPGHETTRERLRAFTLVEILIVVIILGILSAIVVPRFAKAADDAAETATVDQLQKLRRALGVYFVRNAGKYPDVIAGDGTWAQLIDPSYMRGPPVNAWVGGAAKRTILLRASPDTSYHSLYAWVFDPASGNVWAGGFDGNDQPFPR